MTKDEQLFLMRLEKSVLELRFENIALKEELQHLCRDEVSISKNYNTIAQKARQINGNDIAINENEKMIQEARKQEDQSQG